MPEADTQIAELRLEQWLVAVGDAVEPGTSLCELTAITRNRLVRDTESRGYFAKFQRRVVKRQVRGDLAPRVVVKAAESGIVSQIDAAPGATINTDDLLTLIDIGSDAGDGGRFSAIAEILSADRGSAE